MNFSYRSLVNLMRAGMCLILTVVLTSTVKGQLKVDFSRISDVEPLQEGWQPFVGDGIDPWTESFDLEGTSIDVTIEGNTHWRNYREATGGFAEFSDLLRDGPLCNEFCEMMLTLENLEEGDYDVRLYYHTTEFGQQDGRPFTPFAISLTDGVVTNEVIEDEFFMSDDSSEELSTKTIPFRVVDDSPVSVVMEKFESDDHMALPGFELGPRGSLGNPPKIEQPSPIEAPELPDGFLKVDFSRQPDESPLQEGWEPFVGEGMDVFTEVYEAEGKSVELTIEGNTHWRDYRPATGPFAGLSDLLSDGPLCNDVCMMGLGLEGLPDGEYELTAILHTTQFGPQDGRPFNPFEIRLSDATLDNELIVEDALMSDDSSDELSTETIPFTVSGGSGVEITLEKLQGDDHLALAGLILSSSGPNGDFSGNGVLDAADMDLLSAEVRSQMDSAAFDLNADGNVNDADRTVWIKELKGTWFGDANLDGEFNSTDFVDVFQTGKFELAEPAGWAEGDWNGDGRFSSGDFVVAFQDGGFETGPLPTVRAVPEPAGLSILLSGLAALLFTMHCATGNRQ